MRKTKRVSVLSHFLLVLWLTASAAGEISIIDTGSYSHPYVSVPADKRYIVTSGDLGGFNPAGADKLVLAISGEKLGSYEEVSYNGVAMTQIVAVTVSSTPRNLAMFYLDNPPSAGDLIVDFSGGNGVGLTVMALSNAVAGCVMPASTNAGTSTSITTSDKNSLIMAAAVNNGTGCPSAAPLTALYSIDAGSSGHGSGYQQAVLSGTTIRGKGSVLCFKYIFEAGTQLPGRLTLKG